MAGPPQILRTAHHRRKDLVVILAPAQVARNAVRQLLPGGIGTDLQESHRCHDEAGHAKGALETLFVKDALLHRMELAVRCGEPFDGYDALAANRLSQHGTRVMRNV